MINKLLGFVVLISLFVLKTEAATYKMQNATINGVCSGTFTDSDGGGITSGGIGNYGNNENFTMTFCANAGQYMSFQFTSITIKSGDHLYVYDGPNASSPQLFHITSSNSNPFTVVSSGTCITFVFTSDGSGSLFSSNGNWTASFSCISPILISDHQTINVCNGIFMDSGGENNYGPNENHVKTICPGNNASCVQLNFMQFESESGVDYLYIYDGNAAAGVPLLTLTGSMASATVTSSFLSCLTVKFVSNGSVNRAGWKAAISCGNCVPQCSPLLTAVAADNCSNAPEICDLNGYCGNTSSSYTVDEPGNFCDGCNLFNGSLENNSWIKFVASDTVASLNIYIPDCDNGDGIQVGVYEATNCNNFVLKSDIAWTSGNGAPFQPLATGNFITATGLTPGMTYYVMIDGFAGDVCDYIISAGSGVSIPMVETYSQTICAGDQITLTASGATTYNWTSNPPGFTSNQPTVTVQPSVTTTYYCTMTRAAGNCPATSITDSVVVTVDNCTSTCNINAGQDVTICIGNSTQITTTATGNGPYTYQWSPATGLNDPTAANPIATPPATTTYSVTMTTNDGCTATDQITITIGNNLSIFVTPQNPVICLNGSITLNASGGSDYTWAPSTGLSSTTGASVTATPGQAITYTVTGTQNGCTGTATVSISLATAVDIELTASNTTVCHGQSTTLSVSFNNPGGGGPYTYSWNNSMGYANPPLIITPNATGVYIVTVTDNCGTTDHAQVNVLVVPLPQPNFTVSEDTLCEHGTVIFTDLTNPAPTAWSWNFGDPASGSLNSSNQQNPSHYFSAVGTYDIILTVTNSFNCSATLVKNDIITVFPGIDAAFEYEPAEPTELDMNIEFYDKTVGATAWYWNFNDHLSIPPPVSVLQNPSWQYHEAGTYPVMLAVKNKYGCKDTLIKEIVVKPDQAWYIPNAFTPNNNGINDKFGLFGIGINPSKYEMTIFNRWGEIVFYSNDINVRWDGRYKGENYVIDGVYLYQFKFQTIDGRDHTIYGWVVAIDPKQ